MATAAVCIFAVLTTQRVEAVDTDRATLATQVREFAEANLPADAQSSRPRAAADAGASALCIDKQYADATGDGALIDASAYGIAYSCEDKVWSVIAVDVGGDTENSSDAFLLFIDRDRNSATGCLGDDRVVVAFWDDLDQLVAGALNTPTCDTNGWTDRGEGVYTEFVSEDSIGIAFPHSVINSGTFGWWLLWSDVGENFDAMPETGWRNVVLPGVSTIQFRTLQYNAPGTDSSTNRSLNNEWVGVRNYGPTSKNLKGYTVRDAQNNVYTFKTNFYLAPDKSVKIRTGRGTNTATDVYWGRTSHVWGNSRDNAILRNADRVTKDACSWTTPGTGSKVCAT
jgi:hypothetical protein